MAEDGNGIPLLLIPGNHDIDPDEPFQLDDFEQSYGAAQFDFSIGPYLFIFLNDAPPYDQTGGYLTYLEEVIARHQEEDQQIFVFMHVPPSGLDSLIQSRPIYDSQRFMQLAQQYDIRYVFAGDHHGYVKTQRGGTTYIVTGGGGARLRGEHGGFHHLVRMAIHDGVINETVIATEKQLETVELIERNLIVYVWAFISKDTFHGLITALGTLVLLVLFLISVRNWRRFRLRSKVIEVSES